jgi:phage terminase large subunit-like protein
MEEVYDDLDRHIEECEYDVCAFGYDPAYAKSFVERWEIEHGSFFVEKVRQGAMTESVPLGELHNLAEERALLFDESIMQFSMGNAITLQDTNGNRKLMKAKYECKIDSVAAMMDAWVAYKLFKDNFD